MLYSGYYSLWKSVGQSLANDNVPDSDLLGRATSFFPGSRQEIIATLRDGVEQGSGSQYTLRELDPACVESAASGEVFYVVKCSYNTTEGMVTELTDDMTAFAVTPNWIGPVSPVETKREGVGPVGSHT